jgi:hypothetical protein
MWIILLIILALLVYKFPKCFFSFKGEDHNMIETEQTYTTDDGGQLTRILGKCTKCGRWEDDCDW